MAFSKLKCMFKLILLFPSFLIAISPPQNGRMPLKFQQFFSTNNIIDYNDKEIYQLKNNSFSLNRSNEIDSFFLPVILGNYSNSYGTISSEQFYHHLFGNNPSGSFSDYYKEVSYNKFYPTGDVYGWINSDKLKNCFIFEDRLFLFNKFSVLFYTF